MLISQEESCSTISIEFENDGHFRQKQSTFSPCPYSLCSYSALLIGIGKQLITRNVAGPSCNILHSLTYVLLLLPGPEPLFPFISDNSLSLTETPRAE